MTGKRGLSLLEILMVVGILAIVSSAAVPYAEITFVRAKESELQTNLNNIRMAIRTWRSQCYSAAVAASTRGAIASYDECTFYPPSLAALTVKTKYPIYPMYFDGTTEPRPFIFENSGRFITEIPIDPFVGYATWTVTYARGASGVIDVSPVSDPVVRRGFVESIDGTQYKDW